MKRITQNVVFLCVGFLVLYDVVAVLVGGTQATISVQMYLLAQNYPIVPFALGVVFGHLFWLNTGVTKPPPS